MNEKYPDLIMYGCRNLLVLDDEQTRIAGEPMLSDVPDDVRPFVKQLIEMSRYEAAYTVAIIAWCRDWTLEQIRDYVPVWCKLWNNETDDGEEGEPDVDAEQIRLKLVDCGINTY